MKSAMEIYELADEGSPQRTYQFLHRALSIHVEKDRHRRNRSDIVNAMNKFPAYKSKVAMPVAESPEVDMLEITAPAKEKKGDSNPCYAYLRGTCTRGASCRFSHDGREGSLPPLTEAEKKDLAKKRALIPCRMNQKGQCKYGANCQFKHTNDKVNTAAACIGDEMNDWQDEESDERLEDHQYVDFECKDFDGEGSMNDPNLSEDNILCGECTGQSAAICRHDSRIEWIIDTGTENHLIKSSFVEADDEGIHKTDKPMKLATANGTIIADTRVNKDLPELGVQIDPLVLDQTVNAISVGRLVIDEDYSFHWPKGQAAYFEHGDGRVIRCDTKGYVPVISSERDEMNAVPGVGVQADNPDAEQGEEESRNEKLKREAQSPEHCLTHMPKNPYCWVCSMSKMVAKQARRLGPDQHAVNPENFGEHVCADQNEKEREDDPKILVDVENLLVPAP